MPAIPVDLVLYIRMVLNYLGLDANFSPENVHARGTKGQHRSIVRQIGTSLPLKPVNRAHFQIVNSQYYSRRQGRTAQFIDDECEPAFIASLADVLWITTCSPDKNARGRSELRPFISKRKSFRTPRRRTCFTRRPRESDISELPDVLPVTPSMESFSSSLLLLDASTPMSDPTALQKIGQLEDELSKLRAQIAMIVTVQSQQATGAIPAAPAPLPPPPCVSLLPHTCGGPTPPPPPPPPLPPVATSTRCISITEQIRLNRAKKGQVISCTSEANKSKPNMADVLKGLGTVKLRTVARSPGGTPIRQKPRPATANDAAALIAQALKRKFARQRAEDSPDKENRAWGTPSPKKNSPRNASPKFGQHLLKPSKLTQTTRPSRPLVEINI